VAARLNRAREVLTSLLRSTFRPKESVSPSTWVEREIRLDAKTSNKAGRYSLRHTPYLRQIYDDVANPRIRKIIVKKGAQLGLTQFANNVVLYYVCNFTFPALMIMPSKEAAQQFCERSLTPTIRNCKAVKQFLTGNEDDLKKTEYLFSSCIVRIIGAGSPSKLASNPCCLCIIDEADKMEDFASQGEAPALELAEDRTISFPTDKKIIVLSTPTSETTSVIQSQYLLGSQSKYFCKCPKCAHWQTLHFENIKWPNCKLENGNYDLDRIEREAFYQCENPQCLAQATERDKIEMVRGGEWRDTNPKPFPSEFRSYQISALYSFNITWGGLAKLFILSKDDVGKLRNFYNSYLGECFEQRAATIRKDDIDGLIKDSPYFLKGELLRKPDVLIMAADTQGNCFWYGVEAIYDDGSSSLVDWGEAATFEDLDTISRRQYKVRGSEEYYGVYKSLIDLGGNRTTQVYDFCIRSAFRFIPVAGRQERQGLYAPVRETTVAYKNYNLPALLINDKLFKDTLYLSCIKERSGKLLLPADCDDEFKIQLTSERLAEKKNSRGVISAEWICTNRRNHLGDVLKYLEAFKYRIDPELKTRSQQRAAASETNVVEEAPKRQYALATEVRRYSANDWN